ETGGLPGFKFFPHVGKIVIDGPFNATGAKNTSARKKLFVCTPASQSQETACATQIVNNLARRAFRRPVTVRDTEQLLGFFQRGRRMLKDPRSEALVDNFAGQWLSIRSIATQVPVAGMFPDFDDNLRNAMRKEMEMFVKNIIQADRPVTELLDANYTFVNERLA